MLPNKKYQVIYADPPWPTRTWRGKHTKGFNLMSTDEIRSLGVQDITTKDCTLFIWIIFRDLSMVFDVIKSWGFKYAGCAFVWIKRCKNGSIRLGMGQWTRNNAELCLMGIKGHPKRISAGVSQIIESIPQAHAQKPNETRWRIIKLMGDLPRIELFARERVEGWDSWGDEVING